MKLALFCLFVIVSSINSERSNPSYLKHIGSYRYGRIVKDYYLSQRLTDYNWIGAYMFCRMNGMKLVILREFTDEMKYFNYIITDTRVFIGMGVSFGITNVPKCRLYDKGILMHVDCDTMKAEFVCEGVEGRVHLTNQRSKIPHLSRQKFFSYLGDYVTTNNKMIKSYYIGTIMKASPDEGIKYCQSMDMILTSPQNQDEFQNLQILLHNAKFYWQNAAISGYRNTEGKWTDTGDGLAYQGNWSAGEPNNAKANEYCLFLSSPDVTLNDDPCIGYSSSGQFICEFKHQGTKPLNDDIESSRFIEPFMKDLKTELYLSHKHLKLSWIDSKLMCKSFGMDLFTPETEPDIVHVKDFLRTSNITKIRTGVTKIGSDEWYSIISGENNKWFIHQNNYSGQFALITVEGMLIDSKPSSEENFMCQRMYVDSDIETNVAVTINFRCLAINVVLLLIIHLHINM